MFRFLMLGSSNEPPQSHPADCWEEALFVAHVLSRKRKSLALADGELDRARQLTRSGRVTNRLIDQALSYLGEPREPMDASS